MARKTRSDEDDVLDPVEAVDEGDDEELVGFGEVDDPEDEAEAVEVDDEDLDFDGGEDVDDDELEDLDGDEEEDDEALPVGVLDDEDEIAVVVAEEDEDEDDSLREGEFICRSCFMAKRESALADPEKMLCRDCA